MSLPNGQKVIALDFDGVLHDYRGWNEGKLGEPITGMLEVVGSLQAAVALMIVHTTRSAMDVKPWLAKHGFPPLEVHHEKWRRVDVFVDDRAVTFNPVLLAPRPEAFARDLLDFEPHWRRAGCTHSTPECPHHVRPPLPRPPLGRSVLEAGQ